MVRKTTSIFRFRRKALCMLACIFVFLALGHKPWLPLSMLTAKGLTQMIVIVVVGLMTAVIIHELAPCVLRGRGHPWYVRRGTLIFLPIVLVCLNIVLGMVGQLVFKIFGIGPFLVSDFSKCMVTAAMLMWIAFLE